MTLVRQRINVRADHSATVTNNIFHDTFPSLGCEINSFCNICSLYMYNQSFHYFLKVEGLLRLSRKSWKFLVWEVAFPYHLKRVLCSKSTDQCQYLCFTETHFKLLGKYNKLAGNQAARDCFWFCFSSIYFFK